MDLYHQLQIAQGAVVVAFLMTVMLSAYIMSTPPRELPRWLRMDEVDAPDCPLHKVPRNHCGRYHKDDD